MTSNDSQSINHNVGTLRAELPDVNMYAHNFLHPALVSYLYNLKK